MTTVKTNDNKASQSPETVVCESLTVMKIEKTAAESSAIALKTQQEAKEGVRAYKICGLAKAEQSHGFYQDIRTSIALGNFKKATIIQENINGNIKKDGDIEKLIKESSVLLNELRIKMADAHNEACAMSNCVKNKLLTKNSNGGNSSQNEIRNSLKEIMDITKSLDERGQNAFESIVTLAGIQSFTNTEGLKPFVTEFMDKIKSFKEYIDGNIKSTGEEVPIFREDLNKVIEELAQVICDKQTMTNSASAILPLIDFICEASCDGDVLDLCKDSESCFGGENSENNYRDRGSRQAADKN